MEKLMINVDAFLKCFPTYDPIEYSEILNLEILDFDKHNLLKALIYLKNGSLIESVRSTHKNDAYKLTEAGRKRLEFLEQNKNALPLELENFNKWFKLGNKKTDVLNTLNNESSSKPDNSVPVAKKLSFLSYSRQDSGIILKLAEDFRNAGFNIWVDQLDIKAGDRWAREIEKALQICDNIVVVLSPASIVSDNVQDEISYAIEENKRIIPIMVSECKVPLRIRSLQFIDFTKDYADGLKKLNKLMAELK